MDGTKFMGLLKYGENRAKLAAFKRAKYFFSMH
jgi:hypothetical protein